MAGRTPSGIAAEKKGATAGCLMSQPGGKKNGGAPVRARARVAAAFFSLAPPTHLFLPRPAQAVHAQLQSRAHVAWSVCFLVGG